jgi:hypothetical protein
MTGRAFGELRRKGIGMHLFIFLFIGYINTESLFLFEMQNVWCSTITLRQFEPWRMAKRRRMSLFVQMPV